MQFLRTCCFLWLCGILFSIQAQAADEPLLPRPSGAVLDKANVFQPEAVARLETALEPGRRNVWIYVLTIPSLKVSASKQQEELESMAKRYANAWLPNSPGAVIVFDDETGLMSMEASKEAIRRFSEVSMHFKLTDAFGHSHESGLSRERLEKAALATADVLTDLEAQYERERRRQMVANIIMGILAVAGVILAIRSVVAAGVGDKLIVEDEANKPPPST